MHILKAGLGAVIVFACGGVTPAIGQEAPRRSLSDVAALPPSISVYLQQSDGFVRVAPDGDIAKVPSFPSAEVAGRRGGATSRRGRQSAAGTGDSTGFVAQTTVGGTSGVGSSAPSWPSVTHSPSRQSGVVGRLAPPSADDDAPTIPPQLGPYVRPNGEVDRRAVTIEGMIGRHRTLEHVGNARGAVLLREQSR
jgi:hypothetical protein